MPVDAIHIAAVCKLIHPEVPQPTLTSLVIVFVASISGAGFPVVAKKVKWMKIPPGAFFFCKHFGTGVLIATAFVHVSHRSLRQGTH